MSLSGGIAEAMKMQIFAAIKAAFGFGKSVVDAASQHERIENAPDMQTAATAAQEQQQIDNAEKHIADENLDELRKDSAAPLPRRDP